MHVFPKYEIAFSLQNIEKFVAGNGFNVVLSCTKDETSKGTNLSLIAFKVSVKSAATFEGALYPLVIFKSTLDLNLL